MKNWNISDLISAVFWTAAISGLFIMITLSLAGCAYKPAHFNDEHFGDDDPKAFCMADTLEEEAPSKRDLEWCEQHGIAADPEIPAHPLRGFPCDLIREHDEAYTACLQDNGGEL